ncbi:MAG: hypothetical protein M1831_004580 [Alyxoria varia]|nr:MAG: hypothetical protein M1831_004580 [Alyxoria varia]
MPDVDMPHTILRPKSRVRQGSPSPANSQAPEGANIRSPDEGPTPIRPKPANAPSNAGATSQLHASRKPLRGPLVFVNSSDPNAEDEKKGNRKKIKKWAMLNKSSRFNEIDIMPKHTVPENLRSIPHNHECSLFAHEDVSDFGALHKAGMIPSRLIDILPYLFSMNHFLAKVKCNSLSVPAAKQLLFHIWVNAKSLSLLEDECQSPLHHCIRYAMIIHFYSSVFQNPTLGVGWLSGPMKSHLSDANMTQLKEAHPRILLWLLLTAGPFAVDDERRWYLDQLRQVQAPVYMDTVQNNLQQYKDALYWARELDEAATRFWTEARQRTRS